METAQQSLEPVYQAWRRFRFLRQPQPDRADAVVVDGVHHQHDGAERYRIARLLRHMPGSCLSSWLEIIRERGRGLVGRDHKAVDRGELPQSRLAGHEEIPKQVRIRHLGGGMSTKKRSSACAFSGGASK